MKGKIDNNGWLRIERGSKEKLQECPFMQRAFEVNDIVIAPCGDWCPLFVEPEAELDSYGFCSETEGKPTGRTMLETCKTTLIFDQFTDERVGVEK